MGDPQCADRRLADLSLPLSLICRGTRDADGRSRRVDNAVRGWFLWRVGSALHIVVLGEIRVSLLSSSLVTGQGEPDSYT